MNKFANHTAKFFSDLQHLTDEEVSLSWVAVCMLMTKFCAVISVGLLLSFTVGILAGFGHEITAFKLVGGFVLLCVWPIGMGFFMGSIFVLHNRWRSMLRRLLGKKIEPNNKGCSEVVATAETSTAPYG